jgi:hypothetical protein
MAYRNVDAIRPRLPAFLLAEWMKAVYRLLLVMLQRGRVGLHREPEIEDRSFVLPSQ